MKNRSKRHKANRQAVEKGKVYTLNEAVTLLKGATAAKFDESLEFHAKLGIDASKSDQAVRGTLQLPHGTGKTIKIAAFVDDAKVQEAKDAGADIVGGEELIAQIKKTEKIEFDVAVATPPMMAKLGQIAKLLGPRGLMPSPKTKTVTPDIKGAIDALKKGKVDFKSDPDGNLHQILGKMSFEGEQLEQNVQAFIDELKKSKPDTSKGEFLPKMTLTSTMGPSVQFRA